MPGDTGVGGGYQIVADPDVFAGTAAAFLARKLEALSEQGPISLALSGGSTPGPVYEALTASPRVRWDRVHVYLADERVVPLDHPESNFGLVRERLLDPIGFPRERAHPMPVDVAGDDPERAARIYAECLPERLDILVLGVGVDGHTASLFPDSAALSSDEPVAAALAPTEPRHRLTLTPRAILAARLIVVLARGPEKREAVRRALREEGRVTDCPARLARRGIWIVGRDALVAGAARGEA